MTLDPILPRHSLFEDSNTLGKVHTCHGNKWRRKDLCVQLQIGTDYYKVGSFWNTYFRNTNNIFWLRVRLPRGSEGAKLLLCYKLIQKTTTIRILLLLFPDNAGTELEAISEWVIPFLMRPRRLIRWVRQIYLSWVHEMVVRLIEGRKDRKVERGWRANDQAGVIDCGDRASARTIAFAPTDCCPTNAQPALKSVPPTSRMSWAPLSLTTFLSSGKQCCVWWMSSGQWVCLDYYYHSAIFTTLDSLYRYSYAY